MCWVSVVPHWPLYPECFAHRENVRGGEGEGKQGCSVLGPDSGLWALMGLMGRKTPSTPGKGQSHTWNCMVQWAQPPAKFLQITGCYSQVPRLLCIKTTKAFLWRQQHYQVLNQRGIYELPPWSYALFLGKDAFVNTFPFWLGKDSVAVDQFSDCTVRGNSMRWIWSHAGCQ